MLTPTTAHVAMPAKVAEAMARWEVALEAQQQVARDSVAIHLAANEAWQRRYQAEAEVRLAREALDRVLCTVLPSDPVAPIEEPSA